MSNKYLINFDDFCEKNNRLDLLEQLKTEIPNFKATLFTVVGRCSDKFLDKIRAYDWLDMCPHGWRHKTIYGDKRNWTELPTDECENWTEKDVSDYIGAIARFNMPLLFKSPGWKLSEIGYRTFYEHGYWVADIPSNEHKWYKKDKIYVHDGDFKKSVHIQPFGDWGLEKQMPELLALKGNEFMFIKDYIGI